MISFERISVRQYLLELMSPQRAQRRKSELQMALAHLLAHPEEPYMVEGFYVAEGIDGHRFFHHGDCWVANNIDLADNG
jgi:hypothetical protein